MSKISGQLLISGQFQDICDISGISGQLRALHYITHKLSDLGLQSIGQSRENRWQVPIS